jgi:acyl dehydratase
MAEHVGPPRIHRDPGPRYFEDFERGMLVTTRGRTIEASDLSAFAGLVGNHYPIHIDEELGRSGRFGARLAHGSFVLSVAIGLFEQAGAFGDAVVAMLEMTDVQASAPVIPGDTIHAEVEVAVAPRQRAGRHGALDLSYQVLNQRGEAAMRFRQVVLVRKRMAT